jgi:hypothetical protein
MGKHRNRDQRGAKARHGAATVEPREIVTFAALHHDVTAVLGEWSRDYAAIVGKINQLLESLIRNDLNAINDATKRLDIAVPGRRLAPNLFELGPKQCQGGAPRVFLLRNRRALVAAGLEKGSGGVTVAISLARKRATEIEARASKVSAPITLEDVRKILGGEFEVTDQVGAVTRR